MAADEPAPVLVADSIGRSFRGRRVLKSATLWAWPGRVTALLGRNGSGKTTLLKIAAGRLGAGWGTVRFDGRHVRRPRLHGLARQGLMYIPQEGLLARDTVVRRQVEMVARLRAAERGGEGGGGSGSSGRAIRRWAERCRIDGLLDSRTEQLSGGERNRASLALAVLRRPRCLLVDEPLTGSAPLDVELVQTLIRDLVDAGSAVVVTGHEARPMLRAAHRVIWLTGGTTHDLGTPETALERHQFVSEYLGPGWSGEGLRPT